ncbi:hypothetical protein O6H91_05G097700 [Diphasiastrum complanatum]|uniref:Uncharacterized protein n=1 Tax=Diphasiastrum complanatum TaxID=34168 RepID=A0ACC2DRD8_DIPCM|nr:hypothetical protein O6H91_05G097700 [Diphasiastrum complanatum]
MGCHRLLLLLLMTVICAISRCDASARRLLSERSSAAAQNLGTQSTDIKLQLAISHVENMNSVMYDDGTTNEIRCGSVEDQRLCDRQRKLVADQLSDYELPSANKNPAEEPAPVSRP